MDIINFLGNFGIYLQALYIQTFYNQGFTPVITDLQGLKWYSACWFNKLFFYRLLFGDRVEDVMYPYDLTLDNLDNIIRNKTYFFYINMDTGFHYFTMLYPKTGLAIVLSTYQNVPTMSVLFWDDPSRTLHAILKGDLKAYRAAFGLGAHLKPYKEVEIAVAVKPYYFPTKKDLESITEEIGRELRNPHFKSILNQKGCKFATPESIKKDLKTLKERISRL